MFNGTHWSPGHCPHRSVPVEMDESMTSACLDLVLPPACQQCRRSAPAHNQQQQRQLSYQQPDQAGPCDGRLYVECGASRSSTSLVIRAQQRPHPARLLPRGQREGEREGGGGGGRSGPHYHQDGEPSIYSRYGPVEDEDESLERPLPLVSDSNQGNWVQAQHRAMPPPGQWWEKPQASAMASHMCWDFVAIDP